MKRNKPRRLNHYEGNDVKRKIYITVPCKDASSILDIPIVFTRPLIRRAKRGSPYECVISEGIRQYAKDHPNAFPHLVLYVYVIASVIYIIDKWRADGQAGHMYRYMHDFGHIAGTFDKITKKEFADRFDGQGFTLRIRPPKTGGHR